MRGVALAGVVGYGELDFHQDTIADIEARIIEVDESTGHGDITSSRSVVLRCISIRYDQPYRRTHLKAGEFPSFGHCRRNDNSGMLLRDIARNHDLLRR